MEIELQNVTIGPQKRHYRTPDFFFLKLDFEKIELQKRGISLISLGRGAQGYIIWVKRA